MDDTRTSPAATVFRWALPIGILAVSIAGFFFLRALKAAPSRMPPPAQAPLVQTLPVHAAPNGFDVRVNGIVAPKREVTIGAEVAGTVIEKSALFDAGTFVSKGTVLARIDPRSFDLELKRLVSELKQAEVDLTQLDLEKSNNTALTAIAESDLALSRSEHERTDELFRRKAASASERDQATSAMIKARNALQQLENAQRLIEARRERLIAQVDLTGSRLEKARLDLEKTTIQAPIDGIVAEDMVEVGSYVQPGTPIGRIEDTEVVEVRCSLRVEDLYWLRASLERRDRKSNEPSTDSSPPGASVADLFHAPQVPATVTYHVAGRSYTWDGFLSRFEGIGIDEKTRTVPCRVEVPRPARRGGNGELPTLVRGMFVTVDLRATPKTPLLEVPATGLRPGNEIWRVREGKLEIRPVRVAKILPDSVLIHDDADNLAAGDKVIVSPLAVAIEGIAVREQEQPGGRNAQAATRSVPSFPSAPPVPAAPAEAAAP